MRSLEGEVILNIPAEKAWKMYTDNEIISKIEPEMLARAQYLEGNGNPGSLRLLNFGPGVSSIAKESTQKIEKVEMGRSVTYRIIKGELVKLYNPYRVTFSFIPMRGNEREKCIAGWKAEFEPLTPATPPPERARDAALGFLKSFDMFVLSY